MRKNIILILFALFLLVSCTPSVDTERESSTESNINEAENSTSGADEFTNNGIESDDSSLENTSYYTVELDNGIEIPLGKIADDALASLGEANSVTEAPSCVYDGMDRLYNYGAFTLTTSPDASGNDRITEISFNSDAVSLKNGISIGSSRAAVEAEFGSDYTESFGVLKFSLDGAELSIVLDEDDTVLALTFAVK